MPDRRPLRREGAKEMTPEQRKKAEEAVKEIYGKVNSSDLNAKQREALQNKIRDEHGINFDFRTTGQKVMTGVLNAGAAIYGGHELMSQWDHYEQFGKLSMDGPGALFGMASKAMFGSERSAFQKAGTISFVGLGLAGAAYDFLKDSSKDHRRPGEVIGDFAKGVAGTAAAAVGIGLAAEGISRIRSKGGFSKLFSNAAKNPC